MPQIVTKAPILAAARRAIEILLEFKGFDVVLTPARGSVVEKPGGGRDFVAGNDRVPQTIALSNLTGDDISAATTDDGQYVVRRYALTGRHDMVIAVGDTWQDAEAEFKVEAVDQSSGFKTAADVLGFTKLVLNA